MRIVTVSIVIPNWNGKLWLGDCLESLRRQSYSDFEVVVVDNGSTDGSQELLQSDYPEVELVSLDRNLGFAKACNTAIRVTSGKYIALLNNDTEADRDWLMHAVSALEARPDISFVASKMLLHGQPDVADACGDFFTVEGIAGKIGHFEPANSFYEGREVFGASAGAAVFRRSLFEDVGLFDENFFMVHEDTDLSFRAQLMGHKCLFVPSAIVYHRVSATLGKESDQHIWLGQRNIELVYFKNMPMPLLIKYLPLHIITNALLLLLYMFRGGARPFLKGKLDAFRLLPKMRRERSRVQETRRVSASDIDEILTRGWLRDALGSKTRSLGNMLKFRQRNVS